MITRFGIFTGFIAILFWFLTIEILHFEEDINILGNIFLLRSSYIFLGVATGLAIFDVSDKIINSHFELEFNHPLTIFFIFVSYAFFFIFQIALLVHRIRKSQFITSRTFLYFNTIELLVFLYFCSFSLAFLMFYLGNVLHTVSPIWWIICGLVSQISISLLLIKIPIILLTTEEPCLLMILSESGTSLFAKNFSSDIHTPEQLIAGYLSALDSLGSKIISSSGIVTSVKFEDTYTFLSTNLDVNDSPIRFCYIYKGMSYYASTRLTKFIQDILKNNQLCDEIIFSANKGKKMAKNNFLNIQISKNFQNATYE